MLNYVMPFKNVAGGSRKMPFKGIFFLDHKEKFAALHNKNFISKEALVNQVWFLLHQRKFVRVHPGY